MTTQQPIFKGHERLFQPLGAPSNAAHAPAAHHQQRSVQATPRTTPAIQPHLYINTEHRPTVHRADSIAQIQTGHIRANSAIEPQELMMEVDSEEEDEVDHDKEESEGDYCWGGYHPVSIGEKFGTNNQYCIVRKLGWGHFSTVWLAFDELNDRHVAIKVVRSKTNYTQAALDEIKILDVADTANPQHPGYKHLVKMYEWFYHEGPNGKHVCMVFEVLGQTTLGLMDECRQTRRGNRVGEKVVNLLTLEKSYGGLPLSITKKIAKQLMLALDYLHRECGLIHTDIKPENILIEIKDVEKFVRCLKCSSPRSSRTMSTVSSSSMHSASSRSRCRSRSTPKKKDSMTPVKCSKPLPSPLTASSNVDFKDYFSSNYSLTSSSCSSVPTSSTRESRSQGSVNFYDEAHDPHSTSRPSSFSNSTSPADALHQSQLASYVVSASEANSDDEDEDEQFYDAALTVTSSDTQDCAMENLNSSLSTVSLDEEDIASLINIKLADLGNACFSHYHYTNEIQTRQYRSPEILLGHRWGCSTDMWSVACVIFELLTGDYLFDPKTGKHHSKDDDHIAQILELLVIVGEEERRKFAEYLTECEYARHFFQSDCFTMRSIKAMKYWPLHKVFEEKYHMEPEVARNVCGFLLPMLHYDPKERVDAGAWSNHPWLRDVKGVGSVDREVWRKGEDIKGWTRTYRPSGQSSGR